MHELTVQLELIFGAHIMFMTVQDKTGVAYQPSFQLGRLNTQVSKPYYTVKLNLVRRDLLSKEIPKFDLLTAFDMITPHARINSVMLENNIGQPFPMQTVEFAVYDLEGFTKDITQYCWDNFSEQFTEQLDKVLEEE